MLQLEFDQFFEPLVFNIAKTSWCITERRKYKREERRVMASMAVLVENGCGGGGGANFSDYKNRGLIYVTLLHGTDHH
jgi:hypothetical protein